MSLEAQLSPLFGGRPRVSFVLQASGAGALVGTAVALTCGAPARAPGDGHRPAPSPRR